MNGRVLAGVLIVVSARAAEEPVARLPWDGVLTAGPNCTSPNDPTLDLWAIEDFVIDARVSLSSWECVGTITGAAVEDVAVRIYQGFPPLGGVLVMESVAGTGTWTDRGLRRSTFSAEFDGSTLDAGMYYIAWTVFKPTGFAVSYSTQAEHDIGGGEQSNGWLWNPGGGWGFPDDFKKVPADLDGTGQSGANFTLMGEFVGCAGDLDGDGDADADDFFDYVDSFAAGDFGVCDVDADGDCDADDFFAFLDDFARGC